MVEKNQKAAWVTIIVTALTALTAITGSAFSYLSAKEAKVHAAAKAQTVDAVNDVWIRDITKTFEIEIATLKVKLDESNRRVERVENRLDRVRGQRIDEPTETIEDVAKKMAETRPKKPDANSPKVRAVVQKAEERIEE